MPELEVIVENPDPLEVDPRVTIQVPAEVLAGRCQLKLFILRQQVVQRLTHYAAILPALLKHQPGLLLQIVSLTTDDFRSAFLSFDQRFLLKITELQRNCQQSEEEEKTACEQKGSAVKVSLFANVIKALPKAVECDEKWLDGCQALRGKLANHITEYTAKGLQEKQRLCQAMADVLTGLAGDFRLDYLSDLFTAVDQIRRQDFFSAQRQVFSLSNQQFTAENFKEAFKSLRGAVRGLWQEFGRLVYGRVEVLEKVPALAFNAVSN